MHFFKLLLLPTLVAAIARPVSLPQEDGLGARDAVANGMSARNPLPAPAPIDDSPLSNLEIRQLLNERQLDLSDLSGLLANLSASFQGIASLLSPDSINNIKIVVDNLANVLGSPTDTQLKSLVGTASSLLGSDAVSNLIKQLPTLLGSVSGLLTPTLITNVTDILGAAHILLTDQFATETVGLVNDIAPLVSAIAQVISALLSAVFGVS